MKNAAELKAFLIKHVSPERFYADLLGPEIVAWGSAEEVHLYCPIHNDQWKQKMGKSPSMDINRNGKFKCHSPSCGAYGANIVNFFEQFMGCSYLAALKEIYRRWVHPILKRKRVKVWHRMLLDTPSILRYLANDRGLDLNVVKRMRLGWDGERICIPIYDQFGFCVNVRRYDPTGKLGPKMINYRDPQGVSYGKGAYFYPIESLATKGDAPILLCEGEWDALVALTRGFRALTVTGGAGSWPRHNVGYLNGRAINIAYDVNDIDKRGKFTDAGQIAARRVAERLRDTAAQVKIVKLPLKEAGGDITDYFIKHHKPARKLERLIEKTPVLFTSQAQTPTPQAEPGSWINLRLDQASQSKYYYLPIEIDCLVAGKMLSPFLPPKRVKVTTTDPETDEQYQETFTVRLEGNKRLLHLVDCTELQQRAALSEMFGLSGSDHQFETLETFNMEELRLIPAINLHDIEGSYVIRRAFYIGHGIESNRTYRMRGFTLPDPKNQSVVHIITEAVPVHDNVDKFELTADIRKRLASAFRPRESVAAHFDDLADWLSRNVTKIKQRPDLHTAIDLVFHSVMKFDFNNEEVSKGWLEALVLGDTRCGKGYVAERLSRFYRLGEVVTGENCTFAGLVGGLQQNGKAWMITWGKLPLNDKRLVIIDEASAMNTADIGRMSRVRSEGVAEITKILSERTRSRTRLIWLSNPRSGKAINTYNNGVEAIQELMGSAEDVSRFDLAMTVASSEVPSRTINSPGKASTDADRLRREDFTNLVLWAWSRRPEQVQFTEKATKKILETAIQLGRRYSPSVPLIQAENIRVKLAKIAAAVAVRCFSTDPSGQILRVKSQHVAFARDFLAQLYSKPSMGYDAYSDTDLARGHLKNEDAVITIIEHLDKYKDDFIDGCLEGRQITVTDVSDWTGGDIFAAKELIGKLVRLRCIVKEDTFYVKRPAFIQLLRQARRRYGEV